MNMNVTVGKGSVCFAAIRSAYNYVMRFWDIRVGEQRY